jgi:Tfp pilus assembly protein PilV
MNSKAFSLIEVVVAIFFFTIGFGALFFMFGSSNKQVFVAQKDLIAYSIARERLSWLEELDYSVIADLSSYDLFSNKMLKNGY